MIKSIKQAKDLASKYNSIKTDVRRLDFLKDNSKEMKVVLDNDETMVGFIIDEDLEVEEMDSICEIHLKHFDNCHYWNKGVIMLFEFAGITAESC